MSGAIMGLPGYDTWVTSGKGDHQVIIHKPKYGDYRLEIQVIFLKERVVQILEVVYEKVMAKCHRISEIQNEESEQESLVIWSEHYSPIADKVVLATVELPDFGPDHTLLFRELLEVF